MSLTIQRMLVAVDLSSCSGAALEFASGLGQRLGAALEVLFVCPKTPEAPALEAEEAAAKSELHRFIARIVKAPVSVTERVEAGNARERIVSIAESEGFDAIVLGTHGRTGRARSLAGSVAESVVRTASCPVITVRER